MKKLFNRDQGPGRYRITYQVTVTTTALTPEHAIEKLRIGGRIPDQAEQIKAIKL